MAGTQARRGTKARLADDTNFRRMWATGVPLAESAQGVDIAVNSVTRLARKYEYPPRDAFGKILGAMPSRPAVDQPQPLNVAETKACNPIESISQTHPRWPVEYDVAVLKTQGRYSRIVDLSKSIERPINAILARWHQLRAA